MKLTKKQIYIIGATILIIILGYLFFSRPKDSLYSYTQVSKGDVVQEVSVTGRVKPSENVSLAFERGGKVTGIYVDVGDKVSSGKILMRLDNSELLAQLAGAEANLKAQQAKLDELKAGTRQEEIKIQEGKVASANVALEDSKNILINSLSDAFTKSDDAIRNKVDQFFNNPKSSNPTLTFVLADGQLKSDIEWGRYGVESILNNWKILVDSLATGNNLDLITSTANSNLNSIKLLLDKIASGVNSLNSSASLTQTTIDTYKSSVSTARANVNLAISGLSSAYEGYGSAKSNLSLQENQLILEKAGATSEQITAQEAQVEKMMADIDNYKAQIAKTYLRSPIDGVVTKQDSKVGEIVLANSIVVSVMSNDEYEIEVNVPEADIAKIKIGDSARITLDAYGSGVIFSAHVISIDPGEIMVEGVATYKTTLQFDKKEDSVKSGMTANIDILTNKKVGVLVLPQRAILNKDGERFVQLNRGNNFIEERKIEVGLKGSDGNIEIVSGLNDGDEVVSSPTL
ncbi:MAG: efflux RND transporter periplasmic adaptor subunit [Minisyncoccota bacterium]